MHFLKLASNGINPPPATEFVWPYSVDVSVDAPRPRVVFAEGVAHGAFGGVFGIRDALGQHWRKHIDAANGEWLMPYLRRIAAGDTVTERELVDDFQDRHGQPPEGYDWDAPSGPVRFLQLASGDEAGGVASWPYSIDVSVDELPPLVAFSAGPGPMSSGGVFSLRSAMSPDWAHQFEGAGGDWLLPYLRRMADGEDVGEIGLEHAYFDRHGHPPGSYTLTTMNWRG